MGHPLAIQTAIDATTDPLKVLQIVIAHGDFESKSTSEAAIEAAIEAGAEPLQVLQIAIAAGVEPLKALTFVLNVDDDPLETLIAVRDLIEDSDPSRAIGVAMAAGIDYDAAQAAIDGGS